jgi:hypothetical protein
MKRSLLFLAAIFMLTGCLSIGQVECRAPSERVKQAAPGSATVYDFLLRMNLPGVYLDGERVYVRGKRAKFAIDGTLMYHALFLHPADILSVRVVHISELSATYGMRAGGPVIEIETRRC